MEYYYTPKEYISTSSLTIVDDEAKHLARVLRKSAGEEIHVTDGEGNVYKVKINSISKEVIDCTVIERFQNLHEPERKITLYQSMIKNPDRFEFVIEKAVELGVYNIQPVITENVINKTTNKAERWQSIALSAMKQSQRCFLPKVNEPIAFNEAIAVSNELKLIAHEKIEGALPLFDITKNFTEKSISIFIGPEGGFNDNEIITGSSNGCCIVNLGPRKFRSETAAILALGLLLNN